MTCPVFEESFESLLGSAVGPGKPSVLEEHAKTCGECAELLRVALKLNRSGSAFAAHDPGHEYWVSFNRRLEGKIEERRGIRMLFVPSRVARLSLAFSTLGMALLAILVLGFRERIARPGPNDAKAGMVTGARDEAVLLQHLDQAGLDSLDEALEGVLPSEPPSPEDLAVALGSLADESESPPAPVTPYDLFLDMPIVERGRLLKEMQDEIG